MGVGGTKTKFYLFELVLQTEHDCPTHTANLGDVRLDSLCSKVIAIVWGVVHVATTETAEPHVIFFIRLQYHESP